MTAEYQVRETREQDQKVFWVLEVRGMYERMRWTISTGSSTSFDELDWKDSRDGSERISVFMEDACILILSGCDISIFQLLWASSAMMRIYLVVRSELRSFRADMIFGWQKHHNLLMMRSTL